MNAVVRFHNHRRFHQRCLRFPHYIVVFITLFTLRSLFLKPNGYISINVDVYILVDRTRSLQTLSSSSSSSAYGKWLHCIWLILVNFSSFIFLFQSAMSTPLVQRWTHSCVRSVYLWALNTCASRADVDHAWWRQNCSNPYLRTNLAMQLTR